MYGKAEKQDLSRSQLDSARLGFYQLLRRRHMSPQFIDRHGEELFAQACFEYTRRAAEVRIDQPPAWIVTCAWNRTKSLLESEDYRPRLVSMESLDWEDDRAGPEETFLEEDRSRRVQEAVEELPLYQRELLALSYFEDESVREAGRRLGWTASKAQRAHEAAQKRIFKFLGVESSDDLQLEVGLFAFLTVCVDRATGHTLPAGLEAAIDSVHHRLSTSGHDALSLVGRPFRAGSGHALSRPAAAVADRTEEIGHRGPLGRIADLGRRLASGGLGNAGPVLAGEGGGRALEVCKGVAVCVIGGSAVTTALIGGGAHTSRPVAHHQAPAKVSRHQRSSEKPVPAAPVAQSVLVRSKVPDKAAPNDSQKPAERHASTAEAPKIEKATVTAPATTADTGKPPDAKVQGEFRNYDAIEEEEGTTSSTSVADSASTTEPESGAPPPSPAKKAEEASAVKEFQGLLE